MNRKIKKVKKGGRIWDRIYAFEKMKNHWDMTGNVDMRNICQSEYVLQQIPVCRIMAKAKGM